MTDHLEPVSRLFEILAYEDELPESISGQDYDAWFELSWVDGVRVGPWPLPAQALGARMRLGSVCSGVGCIKP